YIGAVCRFNDICKPDAGDGGCQANNVPPETLTQRADLWNKATQCVVGLTANACGDAGAAVQTCTDNAFDNATPSATTVGFCQADGLTACMLAGCLSSVGIYSDGVVKKMNACLPAANDAGTADGGCDPFVACVQAARQPSA